MRVDWELYSEPQIDFEPYADNGRVWGGDEYIRIIEREAERYEGLYEATPSWDEQVYPTADKVLFDDFTVHSIVKLEVPNIAGGLTLTI